MATDDPIRTRLLRIVSLIKEGDRARASSEIDLLDRDLFGPLMGGSGKLYDIHPSVLVSNLLDEAEAALDVGDSEGVLILMEQAITAWSRSLRDDRFYSKQE